MAFIKTGIRKPFSLQRDLRIQALHKLNTNCSILYPGNFNQRPFPIVVSIIYFVENNPLPNSGIIILSLLAGQCGG